VLQAVSELYRVSHEGVLMVIGLDVILRGHAGYWECARYI